MFLERNEERGRVWTAFFLIALMGAGGIGGGCIQPSAKGEEEASTAQSPDYEVKQAATSEEFQQAQVEQPGASNISAIAADEMEMRLNLPDVIEQVMPSVVGISTERKVRSQTRATPFNDPFFRQFFGPEQQPQQPRDRTQQGIGSGVIIDKAGVVLTNNHVIEGADSIRVTLSDGRELEAEVEGTDPSSDIAVLRIKDVPADLRAMTFGDSDGLRLGESVIAIGNPFGLSGTVTLGIISAMGRANMGIVDYEDFIQTDAAINPGNSGGALINLDGELVGINTAIMTRSGGYQGVGFAIPSNMVQVVMNSLLEDGVVARGWLGVVIQQLTPELTEALELESGLRGVVVSDVQPGSPAQVIGFERGDVITSIDGVTVRTPSALRNAIGLRSPGAEIEVQYIRGGEPRSERIVLGSLADAQRPEHRPGAGGEVLQDSGISGLSLKNLDGELRRQFNVSDAIRGGVIVTGIEPDSEGARLQFRKGDVILEVNRRAVNSVGEFAAAYDPDRRQNLFLLYRDGATIFMAR